MQDRARRTQAMLLASVEALAEEEGCAAVTTTRVAAACGVSVGTIYRYFPDREALLAAAYDATVQRIVARCLEHFPAVSAEAGARDAIEALLDAYIAAAEAIPAHALLLREMRRLRPGAAGAGDGEEKIVGELIGPALHMLGVPDERVTRTRLEILFAILSNLVDLYLVADDADDRALIRRELYAQTHVAFERLFQ